MAYYSLEPFGSERDNLHTGIVAAMIGNANRDKDKHPKPFEPSDFMLSADESSEEKTPNELYGMIRSWALMSGAKHGNA